MHQIIAALLMLIYLPLASAIEIIPKMSLSNSLPGDPLANEIPSRVTYEITGHHLGDNLMSYVRGKWISFNYNIPLLFQPFPYSNQFKLYEEEKKHFRSVQADGFDTIHEIKNEWEVCFEDISKTLYIIPSFTEAEAFYHDNRQVPLLEIDWESKEFRKMVKKLLKPTHSFANIKIPRGRISVAVYIPYFPEENAGENLDPDHYLEYPPFSYYVEQIKKINKMFYSRPLYVYIFSESRHAVT